MIRRGVTLVELLVVISILVLLMGVAAAAMRFSLEGRRTREAARAISVYCGSARVRAMETGRPVGVVLHRFLDPKDPTNPAKGLPGCAMRLEQAEMPLPYAGDTLDAVAQVEWAGPQAGGVATLTATFAPAGINGNLVQKGDLVQFNHQGPFYTIAADPAKPVATSLTLEIRLTEGQMLPWPSTGSSRPVPYEIFRRPWKSAVRSLQLPDGAVVDLGTSGTDSEPALFAPAGPGGIAPITIMFSPTGRVDRIYVGTVSYPVTEPIFLLVGQTERVRRPDGTLLAEDGKANWQDPKNLWVTLMPQTGLVTTTEVAAVDPAITDPTVGLPLAREYAREAESMGGR